MGRRMSTTDKVFYKLDRERLWVEQGRKCYYCKAPIKRDELTFDHVVPYSVTGYHSVSNCVVSCYDCNQRKANHDKIPARISPEIDQLLDHGFRRIDDRVKRFAWIWDNDPKGTFNKWKRYWEKRGRF